MEYSKKDNSLILNVKIHTIPRGMGFQVTSNLSSNFSFTIFWLSQFEEILFSILKIIWADTKESAFLNYKVIAQVHH